MAEYPRGRKWSGGPDWQIRALLATNDHDAVGYRLPVTELVATADEDSVVGHLGPDLLGPDWDLDEAVRRIESQPECSIGEALLDQRNLAGIGTFYRAELCFLQGIHPRTPVNQVRNLRRLVHRGQQLHANRWRLEQSTTAIFGPETRVRVRAARGALPSPRSPIRMEEFGPLGKERLSYWCPRCQPTP